MFYKQNHKEIVFIMVNKMLDKIAMIHKILVFQWNFHYNILEHKVKYLKMNNHKNNNNN